MQQDRFFFKSSLAIALILFTYGDSFAANTMNSPEIETKVYNLVKQANSCTTRGAYAEARDILVQAAANDPTSYSAVVHEALAESYRMLKNDSEAISEAHRALSLDPSSERPYYTLALAYYEAKDFDAAIKFLKQYMQVGRDNSSSVQDLLKEINISKNLNQGYKLMKNGRYREAKKYIQRAKSFGASRMSSSVLANYAYVLQRTGEPEQAVAEGKNALKLDPQSADVVYTVALAYQDMGDFREAISWLRRYTSMETGAANRDQATKLIQNLMEDSSKVEMVSTKPDYMEQMSPNGYLERWPKGAFPLKVYISDDSKVYGYRPQFKSFILKSLDTWCQSSGKKLSYVLVKKGEKADIKISFTREQIPYSENNRQRLAAGLTHVETDSAGTIESAKVQVGTVNPYDPNTKNEDGECFSTVMHEVGHALGMQHSKCVSDVMYFGSSSKQSGYPTERDKHTIAALYAPYPPVTFTPQTSATTDTNIEFLPPPAFVPPAPSNPDKLPPPMFLPPALSSKKLLPPPLFVPPALDKKPETKQESLPIPLFTPPLPKEGSKKAPHNADKSPLFFTPPLPK